MGPDAMTLVFWMLSFKPTFSLFSFTFIKRLFSFSSRGSSSPPRKRYRTEWTGLCHLTYMYQMSLRRYQKTNLSTVVTGRGVTGNWERGAKAHSSPWLLLCLLHIVLYAPITCISIYLIIHGQRSCRMQAGSIPPPACLLQKRPGEPQQSLGSLWIFRILVMLAGVVGRLYKVSPGHLLWGKACQEFWRHRGYWDKVHDTKTK